MVMFNLGLGLISAVAWVFVGLYILRDMSQSGTGKQELMIAGGIFGGSCLLLIGTYTFILHSVLTGA